MIITDEFIEALKNLTKDVPQEELPKVLDAIARACADEYFSRPSITRRILTVEDIDTKET